MIVVIDCEHLCMTMRGVHNRGAHGHLGRARHAAQPATRAEAMSLIIG